MSKDFIRVIGARQHNLKNLSLTIPRDQLVVFTGPSGSGKSSLAFDTLFAEGQRKYIESLSAYARQFLDQLQKPDVDHIEGLSPAIAIEQRTSGTNPRSTIATTTEIYDYLRLLYAHLGQAHDPETGVPMTHQSASQITDRIATLPDKSRLILLAPVIEDQRGEFRDVLERLQRDGFVRARIDGEIQELNPKALLRLDPKAAHTIEAVIDRIVMVAGIRVRLADSVEAALRRGDGRLRTLHQPPDQPNAPWIESLHSTRMCSPSSGRSFDTPTPQLFSFNSPKGACPVCHGAVAEEGNSGVPARTQTRLWIGRGKVFPMPLNSRFSMERVRRLLTLVLSPVALRKREINRSKEWWLILSDSMPKAKANSPGTGSRLI